MNFQGVTDFASEHSYTDDKSIERIPPPPLPAAKRHGHNNSKANPKVHEGYYAATDILTVTRPKIITSVFVYILRKKRDRFGVWELPRAQSVYYKISKSSR